MKKYILPLMLLLSLSPVLVSAQVDTVIVPDTLVADTVYLPSSVIDTAIADTAWKAGGMFALQFTQAAYSNWQAGGVNSVAGNARLDYFVDYDNGGKWTWANLLSMAYGLNYQDDIYNKTDDRLELESRLDRKMGSRWNFSGLANFRTQFTNGYAEPGQEGDSIRISTFMAPGYLTTGLGFTYKPNKRFRAFLSPLTSKMTFVLDERLSSSGDFGVEPGEQFRMEIGGYVNLSYRAALMENIDLRLGLNLYENYLDQRFNLDVIGEMMLFFKVNKFITANLALNTIYDEDILFDTNEDGTKDAPRTQFKQVLGIGIAYDFGHEMKKKK